MRSILSLRVTDDYDGHGNAKLAPTDIVSLVLALKTT
jgi:hypothetical protein